MSYHIRIHTDHAGCHDYAGCHSVFQFGLTLLFLTMDLSKFKDGRDHFSNSGVKELTCPLVTITLFTISIGTPYLLTILVLKFDIVHSTSVDVSKKNCCMYFKQCRP